MEADTIEGDSVIQSFRRWNKWLTEIRWILGMIQEESRVFGMTSI